MLKGMKMSKERLIEVIADTHGIRRARAIVKALNEGHTQGKGWRIEDGCIEVVSLPK